MSLPKYILNEVNIIYKNGTFLNILFCNIDLSLIPLKQRYKMNEKSIFKNFKSGFSVFSIFTVYIRNESFYVCVQFVQSERNDSDAVTENDSFD